MKKKMLLLCLSGAMLVTFMFGCGVKEQSKPDSVGSGSASNKITVASKPFTENYILAEIMVQLLDAKTDLVVENRSIEGGTTSVLHPALMNGDIDIYPEYTGTGWQDVLKHEKIIADPQKLYSEVKKEYLKKYDIQWLPMFGFNDTFTLAMPKAEADKAKIESFSDLAAVSKNYVFGSEPDFYERKDGYDGLVTAYGFEFKSAKQMAIALKYKAIEAKQVDVINAFSTDGMLMQFDMKVLKDDKNYFPSYFCAPIIRTQVLKQHPEIGDVLSLLKGQIGDAEMARMNYLVDVKKRDVKAVASDFLKEKGLVK